GNLRAAPAGAAQAVARVHRRLWPARQFCRSDPDQARGRLGDQCARCRACRAVDCRRTGMSESVPAGRINISLLSHTNVGKTTLARTLLRKDIGEVSDRPHVTDVAESHVLIESSAGDSLILWDTPGFGDSTRVLKRLKQGEKPLGWFLTH